MAQHNDNKDPAPELGEQGPPAEPASAEAPVGAARPKKKKAAAAASDSDAIRDRNRRVREQAREKRSAKRASQKQKAARNLDASEIVDDALARTTHAAAGWLKRHFNTVQWLLVGALVIWVGSEIYVYRQNKERKKASDALAAAVAAQFGHVGAADDGSNPERALPEPRQTFASDAARSQAAAQAYEKAANAAPSVATLADLGLAGVRFDQKRFADAKAAYQRVKDSALAGQDKDVRARAIEGLGLSLEALGERELAEKAFHELENLDVPWFTALGLFHQARLLHAAKDDQKAEELLKQARAKLDADSLKALAPGSHLEDAIRELLESIDPNAVVATPRGFTEEQMRALEQASGSGPGKLTPDKLNELLKQLGARKGAPRPPSPAPPASAP